MRRKLAILGLVVLTPIVLWLPHVMPSTYYATLLNLAGIFIVATLGLNFILGWAGQISLAHAAFFGIGAYTSALMAVRLGVPFFVGLAAAIVVSGIIGLLIGIPTLRLKGHYLALATIGFGEIIRLILNNWESFTGGAQGVKNIPKVDLGFVVIRDDISYFYLILAFVVIGIVIAARIQQSTFGRVFKAIRESEVASEVMGINTTVYKVLAMAFSAMYAGAGGSLYAHMFGYISPDTYGFDLLVQFTAMLLVGGSGSIVGVVIGSVLLTFLPEWLRVLKDYWLMIYGIGLVLIVVFMPYGIVGLYQRFLGYRVSAWLDRFERRPVKPTHVEKPTSVAVESVAEASAEQG